MSTADDLSTLRHSIEELSFLQHLARVTSSELDPDQLCALVIRETCDVLGVEVCSLYQVDGDEVVLTATNGLNPVGVDQARMPLGVGITGAAAVTRSTIAVRDVALDPRFHWIDGVDQERFTSMCSVPLISGGTRVVGVLNVQTELPHDWTRDET
ncbi:MAG: GAF domain-containing protein, partial [Candidatus Dormibacteria bacterium]